MPNLKYIMQNALSSDYRMLRGKTIECISLIGLAVGKEKVSVVLQSTFKLVSSFLSRYVGRVKRARAPRDFQRLSPARSRPL